MRWFFLTVMSECWGDVLGVAGTVEGGVAG